MQKKNQARSFFKNRQTRKSVNPDNKDGSGVSDAAVTPLQESAQQNAFENGKEQNVHSVAENHTINSSIKHPQHSKYAANEISSEDFESENTTPISKPKPKAKHLKLHINRVTYDTKKATAMNPNFDEDFSCVEKECAIRTHTSSLSAAELIISQVSFPFIKKGNIVAIKLVHIQSSAKKAKDGFISSLSKMANLENINEHGARHSSGLGLKNELKKDSLKGISKSKPASSNKQVNPGYKDNLDGQCIGDELGNNKKAHVPENKSSHVKSGEKAEASLDFNDQILEDFQIEPEHSLKVSPHLLREVYLEVGEIRSDLGQTQASILNSTAQTMWGYNLSGMKMIVSKVDINNPLVLSALKVDYVEISFKDQYQEQSGLWKLWNSLKSRALHNSQTVNLQSAIRATVRRLYRNGHVVASGYVDKNTMPLFRSESSRVILMLQVSSETREFEDDGVIMAAKNINFLSELFSKWEHYRLNHIVTIVLFSRVLYNDDEIKYLDNVQWCEDLNIHYIDYYKVLAYMETRSNWKTIIPTVRLEIKKYAHDILELELSSKKRIVLGKLSRARKGNILESINMSLNSFLCNGIDRDLVRSGQSLIIVTPSNGVFDVNRLLLRSTSERLLKIGFRPELVCLAKIPLFTAPFFCYRGYIVPSEQDFLMALQQKRYRNSVASSNRSDLPRYIHDPTARKIDTATLDPLYFDYSTWGDSIKNYYKNLNFAHEILPFSYKDDSTKKRDVNSTISPKDNENSWNLFGEFNSSLANDAPSGASEPNFDSNEFLRLQKQCQGGVWVLPDMKGDADPTDFFDLKVTHCYYPFWISCGFYASRADTKEKSKEFVPSFKVGKLSNTGVADFLISQPQVDDIHLSDYGFSGEIFELYRLNSSNQKGQNYTQTSDEKEKNRNFETMRNRLLDACNSYDTSMFRRLSRADKSLLPGETQIALKTFALALNQNNAPLNSQKLESGNNPVYAQTKSDSSNLNQLESPRAFLESNALLEPSFKSQAHVVQVPNTFEDSIAKNKDLSSILNEKVTTILKEQKGNPVGAEKSIPKSDVGTNSIQTNIINATKSVRPSTEILAPQSGKQLAISEKVVRKNSTASRISKGSAGMKISDTLKISSSDRVKSEYFTKSAENKRSSHASGASVFGLNHDQESSNKNGSKMGESSDLVIEDRPIFDQNGSENKKMSSDQNQSTNIKKQGTISSEIQTLNLAKRGVLNKTFPETIKGSKNKSIVSANSRNSKRSSNSFSQNPRIREKNGLKNYFSSSLKEDSTLGFQIYQGSSSKLESDKGEPGDQPLLKFNNNLAHNSSKLSNVNNFYTPTSFTTDALNANGNLIKHSQINEPHTQYNAMPGKIINPASLIKAGPSIPSDFDIVNQPIPKAIRRDLLVESPKLSTSLPSTSFFSNTMMLSTSTSHSGKLSEKEPLIERRMRDRVFGSMNSRVKPDSVTQNNEDSIVSSEISKEKEEQFTLQPTFQYTNNTQSDPLSDTGHNYQEPSSILKGQKKNLKTKSHVCFPLDDDLNSNEVSTNNQKYLKGATADNTSDMIGNKAELFNLVSETPKNKGFMPQRSDKDHLPPPGGFKDTNFEKKVVVKLSHNQETGTIGENVQNKHATKAFQLPHSLHQRSQEYTLVPFTELTKGKPFVNFDFSSLKVHGNANNIESTSTKQRILNHSSNLTYTKGFILPQVQAPRDNIDSYNFNTPLASTEETSLKPKKHKYVAYDPCNPDSTPLATSVFSKRWGLVSSISELQSGFAPKWISLCMPLFLPLFSESYTQDLDSFFKKYSYSINVPEHFARNEKNQELVSSNSVPSDGSRSMGSHIRNSILMTISTPFNSTIKKKPCSDSFKVNENDRVELFINHLICQRLEKGFQVVLPQSSISHQTKINKLSDNFFDINPKHTGPLDNSNTTLSSIESAAKQTNLNLTNSNISLYPKSVKKRTLESKFGNKGLHTGNKNPNTNSLSKAQDSNGSSIPTDAKQNVNSSHQGSNTSNHKKIPGYKGVLSTQYDQSTASPRATQAFALDNFGCVDNSNLSNNFSTKVNLDNKHKASLDNQSKTGSNNTREYINYKADEFNNRKGVYQDVSGKSNVFAIQKSNLSPQLVSVLPKVAGVDVDRHSISFGPNIKTGSAPNEFGIASISQALPNDASQSITCLTNGREVQYISHSENLLSNSGQPPTVNITRYEWDFPSARPSFKYKYMMWPRHHDTGYLQSEIELNDKGEQLINWNSLDHLIAGNDFGKNDDAQYTRTRYILIPMENLPADATEAGKTFHELNEEEVRILNFEKFLEQVIKFLHISEKQKMADKIEKSGNLYFKNSSSSVLEKLNQRRLNNVNSTRNSPLIHKTSIKPSDLTSLRVGNAIKSSNGNKTAPTKPPVKSTLDGQDPKNNTEKGVPVNGNSETGQETSLDSASDIVSAGTQQHQVNAASFTLNQNDKLGMECLNLSDTDFVLVDSPKYSSTGVAKVAINTKTESSLNNSNDSNKGHSSKKASHIKLNLITNLNTSTHAEEPTKTSYPSFLSISAVGMVASKLFDIKYTTLFPVSYINRRAELYSSRKIDDHDRLLNHTRHSAKNFIQKIVSLPFFSAARPTGLSARSPFELLSYFLQHPTFGIQLSDYKWHSTNYVNVFTGSQLVTWILNNIDSVSSRKQAVIIGNEFLERKLLKHCGRGLPVLDGHYLYALVNTTKSIHNLDELITALSDNFNYFSLKKSISELENINTYGMREPSKTQNRTIYDNASHNPQQKNTNNTQHLPLNHTKDSQNLKLYDEVNSMVEKVKSSPDKFGSIAEVDLSSQKSIISRNPTSKLTTDTFLSTANGSKAHENNLLSYDGKCNTERLPSTRLANIQTHMSKVTGTESTKPSMLMQEQKKTVTLDASVSTFRTSGLAIERDNIIRLSPSNHNTRRDTTSHLTEISSHSSKLGTITALSEEIKCLYNKEVASSPDINLNTRTQADSSNLTSDFVSQVWNAELSEFNKNIITGKQTQDKIPPLQIECIRTLKLDLDPQKKSSQPETALLHIDSVQNPQTCFHFALNWLNCTPRLIYELVHTLTLSAKRCGMKLVEVPISKNTHYSNLDPFYNPRKISLSLSPPPSKSIFLKADSKTSELTTPSVIINNPGIFNYKNDNFETSNNGIKLSLELSIRSASYPNLELGKNGNDSKHKGNTSASYQSFFSGNVIAKSSNSAVEKPRGDYLEIPHNKAQEEVNPNPQSKRRFPKTRAKATTTKETTGNLIPNQLLESASKLHPELFEYLSEKSENKVNGDLAQNLVGFPPFIFEREFLFAHGFVLDVEAKSSFPEDSVVNMIYPFTRKELNYPQFVHRSGAAFVKIVGRGKYIWVTNYLYASHLHNIRSSGSILPLTSSDISSLHLPNSYNNSSHKLSEFSIENSRTTNNHQVSKKPIGNAFLSAPFANKANTGDQVLKKTLQSHHIDLSTLENVASTRNNPSLFLKSNPNEKKVILDASPLLIDYNSSAKKPTSNFVAKTSKKDNYRLVPHNDSQISSESAISKEARAAALLTGSDLFSNKGPLYENEIISTNKLNGFRSEIPFSKDINHFSSLKNKADFLKSSQFNGDSCRFENDQNDSSLDKKQAGVMVLDSRVVSERPKLWPHQYIKKDESPKFNTLEQKAGDWNSFEVSIEKHSNSLQNSNLKPTDSFVSDGAGYMSSDSHMADNFEMASVHTDSSDSTDVVSKANTTNSTGKSHVQTRKEMRKFSISDGNQSSCESKRHSGYDQERKSETGSASSSENMGKNRDIVTESVSGVGRSFLPLKHKLKPQRKKGYLWNFKSNNHRTIEKSSDKEDPESTKNASYVNSTTAAFRRSKPRGNSDINNYKISQSAKTASEFLSQSAQHGSPDPDLLLRQFQLLCSDKDYLEYFYTYALSSFRAQLESPTDQYTTSVHINHGVPRLVPFSHTPLLVDQLSGTSWDLFGDTKEF